MMFLGHVHDRWVAAQTSGLLRSKGIPTFQKWSGTPRGPFRVALFVCLDEHYQDARALLENPDHVVGNPVDVAEFDRLSASQPVPNAILKWLFILLVFAALFFTGALFLAGYDPHATMAPADAHAVPDPQWTARRGPR